MIDFVEMRRKLEESIADGSMDKYFNDLFKYDDDQHRRVENKINSLSQEEIDKLFISFLSWEEKYEDLFYKKHILTNSRLFNAIVKYAEENGVENDVDDSDESFLGKRFSYLGYVFSLYIGQGSFWRFHKDGNLLFQSR